MISACFCSFVLNILLYIWSFTYGAGVVLVSVAHDACMRRHRKLSLKIQMQKNLSKTGCISEFCEKNP